MGVTVRTHLLVELLPCLLDLPAALGWQTTAVVTLFALLVRGSRPRPATAADRPRPGPRPAGTMLCLATLVLLVLLAA